MVSAIIVAGGKGSRMGAEKNKIFLNVLGKEVITRTIGVFEDCVCIDEIIVVTGNDDIELVREIVSRERFKKISHITEGGKERQDSVYNGLKLARGEFSIIHDGARCVITPEEVEAVVADMKTHGAAAIGVPVKDTLKTINGDGQIVSTVDRNTTVHIQTPQGFKTEEILSLHNRAKKDCIAVTDDCSIFEHYGKTVHFTFGSYDNLKITTPEDISVAESILKRRSI